MSNITQDNSVCPALSDLSSGDKRWDNRKNAAVTVANYYRTSQFSDYTDRIDSCSRILGFRLVKVELGELRLKLSGAQFCRVRHCPVCQWRRSLMWKAKALTIFPKIQEDYPTHRWLFLTLTVKNCFITDLRDTLVWMNKSWTRLTHLKKFPAVGWIKSVEITKGSNDTAHPHFHCLLLVKSSYFSGKSYVNHQGWCDMWRKTLRVDYKPLVDVKAIKKDAISIIPELLKYTVKESDLIADRDWFLELTNQLYKTRAVATGGVLKKYLRALESDPEDLIGTDEDDSDTHGDLLFGWRANEAKYRQV